MPLSIEDIQTPVTAEEMKAFLFEQLSLLSFPVQAWQDEGAARSFVELQAATGVELSKVIAELATLVYLGDAKGKFLSKLTASHYDEPRTEAVRSVFNVSMVNSGVSNHVVAAKAVILKAKNGQTYRNVSGATVTGSTTTVMAFIADIAGAAGNVPAQTLEMVTPLAGVQAVYDGNLTTAGADQESDTKLTERARGKWGVLRVTKIHDGVLNLARNAAPNIHNVGIDDQNPRGPGTVDVYLAAENATAGGADVIAVQAALDLAFFGNGSVTKLVEAVAAPTVLMNLTGTVYFKGVEATDLSNAINAAWREFLASIPIGGFDFSPGPDNIVLQGQVVDALTDVSGVVAMVLTSPVPETNVPINTKVIEGTITLTFVPVV